MKCPLCGVKVDGPWLCQLCVEMKHEGKTSTKIDMTTKPKPIKKPCPYRPGTDQKIRVMNARYVAGMAVLHPLDGMVDVKVRNDREENDNHEVPKNKFISDLLQQFRRHSGYAARLKSLGSHVRINRETVIDVATIRATID